jgi:act minimal PKS acyl carrier protein
MSLDDLTSALRQRAGQDDGVELDTRVLDVAFEDLGYDSVALLETCASIEIYHGIQLSDSTVAEARTPRALLAVINAQLAASQPS